MDVLHLRSHSEVEVAEGCSDFNTKPLFRHVQGLTELEDEALS